MVDATWIGGLSKSLNQEAAVTENSTAPTTPPPPLGVGVSKAGHRVRDEQQRH